MRTIVQVAAMLLAVAGSAASGPLAAAETRAAEDELKLRRLAHSTEPKDPAGLVDYATVLNEHYGRGLTPDRNACAALWRSAALHRESLRVNDSVFAALGIERPAEFGEYFYNLELFIGSRNLPNAEADAVFEQFEKAQIRIWSAAEFPEVAAWLADNHKPLAELRRAAHLPHFYHPVVPRTLDPERTNLLTQTNTAWILWHEFGSALAARALLRAGEGKLEEALDDLDACRRLARHFAGGPSGQWHSAGAGLDGIARGAEASVVLSGRLTDDRLRRRLGELAAQPPFPSPAHTLELGERFVLLDVIQRIDQGEPWLIVSLLDDPEADAQEALIAKIAALDFRPVVEDVQRTFDRLATAAREPNPIARRKRVQDVVDDVQVAAPLPADGKRQWYAGDEADLTAAVVGRYLTAMYLRQLPPSVETGDRRLQTAAQLKLAYRLELHRLEQGRYPDQLAELGRPAAELTDWYSGKPLLYQAHEKSYVLYSVGPNGKDDGGRNYHDDPTPGWDDLRIGTPPAR